MCEATVAYDFSPPRSSVLSWRYPYKPNTLHTAATALPGSVYFFARDFAADFALALDLGLGLGLSSVDPSPVPSSALRFLFLVLKTGLSTKKRSMGTKIPN